MCAGFLEGVEQQVGPCKQAGAKIKPKTVEVQLPELSTYFRRGLKYSDFPSFCSRPDSGGKTSYSCSYDGNRAHFLRWSAARSKQILNQVVKASGLALISERKSAKLT